METSSEATAVIQGRDDGDLDQDSNEGSGEKCTEYRCSLKA